MAFTDGRSFFFHSVASGSRDGQVRIWSLETGDLLHVLSSSNWPVNNVLWYSDELVREVFFRFPLLI